MSSRKPALSSLILCPVLLFAALPAWADLVLGVHPFKPASTLIEAFTPLADYLGRQIGEPVTVRISKDYQAHVDAIAADEIDIAYMGPAAYIKLRSGDEEWPLLARQVIKGNPFFHAKIIVAADSSIDSLADLRGKRVAFGEPHSTMSHLVPRYMLLERGITVDDFAAYRFVGDHVNVALGVLSGDFDAGAVKEDVFFKYESRGLRAIATSPDFADHVFVASRTLAHAKVRQIQGLLWNLDKERDGPGILASMTRNVTALVPAKDSDYDTLRAVKKILEERGIDF